MKEEEIMMRRKKASLTRHKFEQLIHGEWVDDRSTLRTKRVNGKFSTYVEPGWKYVSDGEVKLRARTWYELGQVLELV